VPKAHGSRAVPRRGAGGSAHAVARFAKIVRHRGDQAEPAAGFANMHIAGGTAGAVVDIIQRVFLRQPSPHLAEIVLSLARH